MIRAKAKTILIVDDEEQNIELARIILKNEGYTLVFATTGAEAIAILKRRWIDILVLDLMLPDIDGFEVLVALGRSDKYRYLRTIVVSAQNDAETVRRIEKLGADDFLAKPYDIITLKAMIKQLTVSALMTDEEMADFLQREFSEMHTKTTEDEKRKMVLAFLEHDALQTPLETQLTYLAWFCSDAACPFDIGSGRTLDRQRLLCGDETLDRLHDRLNRIYLTKITRGSAIDPEDLFKRAKAYFL